MSHTLAEKLQEALERHGHHDQDCNGDFQVQGLNNVCTCGLDQALKLTEAWKANTWVVGSEPGGRITSAHASRHAFSRP